MEVRVPCPCEQTYAFDVEPVNGAMPCKVSCPACGTDGTSLANEVIRRQLGGPAATPTAVLIAPPPLPVAAAATASPGVLRVNREAAAATPSTPVAAAPPRFASPAAQRIQQSQRAADESHSMGLGILGALGGAGVGAAIMVAFTVMVGIRFPLIGTVTGALTGFGARTLFKGTDSSLGAVAAVIALIATGGTLYALFGPFGMLTSIVSIVISAVMAWRMAS